MADQKLNPIFGGLDSPEVTQKAQRWFDDPSTAQMFVNRALAFLTGFPANFAKSVLPSVAVEEIDSLPQGFIKQLTDEYWRAHRGEGSQIEQAAAKDVTKPTGLDVEEIPMTRSLWEYLSGGAK